MEIIGKGQSGKIYSDKEYAYKKYFEKEYNILKKLNHINIIKVFDVKDDKIQLELCERDLFKIEFLSIETKFNYLYQILEGLEYIHLKNIAH